MQDSTQIGGQVRNFPTTQWNLIQALRSCAPEIKNQILDGLLARYWKPVYYFVRSQGHGNEEAKDLVQGFFAACVERDAIAQADVSRGRFRTFLLTSLTNYMRNVHRDGNAQKRRPAGGILSLDALIDAEDAAFEPPTNETPEHIFSRAWAQDLVHRVLRALEDECAVTGKQDHFALFRARIIEPALEGTKAPSLAELAPTFGISEKQAANYVLTARRAYQRLLREEIGTYALSEEDAAEEVGNVFNMLGSSR